MGKILLGVTGSVAAVKTTELTALLVKGGHEVRLCCTNAALYFFDHILLKDSIQMGDKGDLPGIILDSDEWGWRGGNRYQTGDKILHIEARRWADLFLIAPLDANTLGKMANGMADNVMTCVWRAWEISKPVVIAPAMNTLMWEKRVTAVNLRQMAEEFRLSGLPTNGTATEMCHAINNAKGKFSVLLPSEKQLACGDLGVGAMAPLNEIVEQVKRHIST